MPDFSFDIYAGTVPETDTLASNEEQEQAGVNSQPEPERQFIPRTPDSAKVKDGERGALVNKMISELEREVEERNPEGTTERTVTTDEPNTDLQGIDPEIRDILNSFGIFFFRQIPNHILITYGPLLTREGVDEDYQRMVERDLFYDGNDEYAQDELKSQEVLFT